jgi:hypothetical protein
MSQPRLTSRTPYSAIIFEIRRRYGFWSGWLTHFVTDMVIFFFVVEWASFSWGG